MDVNPYESPEANAMRSPVVRTVKYLVIVLGLIAIVGAILVGVRLLPVSQVYSVRAEFVAEIKGDKSNY